MILAHRAWGSPSDPVALLVHGAADSSATWDRLGPWLADRRWHVIAVDLRGHGASRVAGATADPALDALAADLVDTIGALRPDASAVGLVLGASLGALTGLVCAVAHPSFVERLVLLDPPGVPHSLDPVRHATEVAPLFDDPERVIGGGQRAGERTPDAVIDPTVAAVRACDRAFFERVFRETLAGTDVVAWAARCEVPTLVVLGRDKDTPLGNRATIAQDLVRYSAIVGDERRRFCAALARAQVHELPVGHDIHGAAYADCTALLARWLGGPGAAPASDGRAPR